MRPLTLIRLMLLVLIVAPVGRVSAQNGYDKKSSRNPHGSLNIPCENCHTNTSWKPIRGVPEFDHNRTHYPLRGMHEKVACKLCHTNLVFSSISTRCSDCHADIHRGQFGSKCEDCHTVKGWEIHTQQVKQHDNRFPLLGAHALAECVDCHKSEAVGQFTGLSTACLSCHTADFQNATEPDHRSGFPTTCEVCHSADTWFGAKFDHLKFTGFALTGAHATLECTACHIGGKFKGTPADCYGCHAKDFATTTNPNHVQAAFPQQCQICHTTTSWLGATFDHNQYTKFPLTGAHVNVPCNSCHVNGQYAGTPTDCYSCHTKDYNGTTNPNHVQAGFPTSCTMCHNTTSWANATFNHNNTPFPLTGAHVNVPCATCHINGKYAGTPTDCYSCHTKDYNDTTNPNHVQAGFPTDCSICHSTSTWANAVFNHNNTPFPLTGAHVNVPCASCHINGKYAGTPTDCYSCHTNDYKGTTNPNHVAAGFPTDCSICHNTASWANATFNHNNTPFPLTGAHVNVPCASCHIGNVYAGTPTDCYSCHKADYTGTTNPNHASAGFPTSCQTCHTTTSWQGATFNHTYFPTNHGNANGVCSTCHTNPNDFSVFTCTNCHTKSQTDPKHSGVSGYVYNSVNCYQCHKNGGGGG